MTSDTKLATFYVFITLISGFTCNFVVFKNGICLAIATKTINLYYNPKNLDPCKSSQLL